MHKPTNESLTGIHQTARIFSRSTTIMMKYGLSLYFLVCIPSYGFAAEPSDPRSRIGMNIGGVTDFDSYITFADALRNGIWVEDWSQRTEKPTSLLDDLGRVAVDVPHEGKSPFASIPVKAKAGDVFDLELQGDISVSIQGAERRIYSNNKNKKTIRVRFAKDRQTSIVKITSASQGASFKLFYPGQTGKLFHSQYVDQCRPFHILRGLNWNRTNNSPRVSAADVIPETSLCQASPVWGSSDVLLMKLCHEADADCYITIPHLADESYLKQLAKWCSQWKESTGRQVYLEYSNELWNLQFQQSKWAKEEGKKKYPRMPNEKIRNWEIRALASYAGYRAGKAFKTIDETFSDYHHVVAWQAAARRTGNFVVDEYLRTFGDKPDCWAIAPYMHLHLSHFVREIQDEVGRETSANLRPKDFDENQNKLVAKRIKDRYPDKKILGLLRTSLEDGIARSTRWMQNHAEFAKSKGMRLITYESGQHLLPPIPHALSYPDWASTMIRVQRSPEMNAAYQEYHNAWREAGGAEHIFLSLIQQPRKKTGAAFGHQDFMGDTSSPKWQALMEILEQN